MFLNLVLKEFKNGTLIEKLKKGNFLSVILNILISFAFVVLEIYLFRMINEKLNAFNGASKAFLTIFLFIISVGHILFLTAKVRGTLYSKIDNDILINKPVSPSMNILSKIVFIYLRDVMMNYLIAFPILIVYGYENQMISRVMFIMVMYPFIISIFETGVSYLLSLPYQEIYRFLKRHFIVQVITSIVIIVLLCFVYSYILNAFLVLVRDNNIYAIFSKSTIMKLDNIASYLIPTKYFIQLINLDFRGLFYLVIISLAIFLLGIFISSKHYLHSINSTKESKRKSSKREIKLTSINKALIKKELKLFFEDSNSIFSCSSLLVMEPFLTVLVIQAMNTIFKTGMLTYVTNYFPYLLPLIHILFIALFATFINTSASFVISREKYQGVRICKSIPLSYRKQIYIKMIVPFSLSTISLLVTILVLMTSKQVSVINCLLSFIFTILLTAFLELLSVNSDLKNPSKEGEESNKNSMISLLSIIIPLLLVGLMFALTYFALPLGWSFMIATTLLVIALGGYMLYFDKKVALRFVALEMRN